MYIKLFEDWSIAHTLVDSGIKIIDLYEYQRRGQVFKIPFKSYEKLLLNNFINANREFISDEDNKYDKWFELKIKNIPNYPKIEILIISIPQDIFNVRLTHYIKAHRNPNSKFRDEDFGDLIFKKKQVYYQCDEIESVIRLLKKLLK